MQNDMDRMEELVKILNDYAYHYYVLDKPIVSDYDYDVLYDELVLLEQKLNKVLPSSPTLRVGGEVLPEFKKVEHKVRLYSLNKCNDLQSLQKFVDDVREVVKNPKFTIEYKFDGLRVIVEYKNGLLFRASTRGNGVVGEDITEQVKTIKSVPLQIEYKKDLTIAGEGIITLENLEKYNKTASEKLKNARNAVAGAMRNLDPKVTAKRNLDVVFYDIISIENSEIKTQSDVQNFLKKNKFLTGDLFETTSSIEKMQEVINKVDKEKSKLNILIDGLVFKLDDLASREELGFTAKFPKWAIAYKFAPQEMTSMLKGVEWNVGRTGKINPTGIIEPIELAGAKITRATLNNYDDIKRKKIKINSLVFVRRSNEVIPEILGLAQDFENSKEIEKPIICPCCKEKLQEIGINLFCVNPNCRDKQINKITYFASKNCMDIVGLSDKIIATLFDKNLIRKASDLYQLTPQDFEGIEGFKDKKINNILSSIEKSKNVNLNNFIDALSIDGVGEKTAKDLAKKFLDINSLKNATYEQLININDIGDIIAKNIIEYFSNKDNLDEIERLFELGVNIKKSEQKQINKDSFFYNKKFVLTGTLDNYKRQEATKLIEDRGGEVVSSVSKNTDYVICGADAGSKLDKARALKINILYEKDFIDKL